MLINPWNMNNLLKSDLRKRLTTDINKYRKHLLLPKSFSTKTQQMTIKRLIGYHGQLKDSYMRSL